MIKHKTAKCALALVASAIGSYAQFTATYSFAVTATDVPTVAHLTFTSLAATNVGLTYSPSNQNVIANSWANGSSADLSQYLTLGLQVGSGYLLSLTRVTFKESRSSTGPAKISVGLYIDGILQEMSSTIATTSTSNTATSAMTLHTFDFADKTSIAATSNIGFRVYGWGSTSLVGTLRLDDFTVNGSVNPAAVPEPTAYAAIFALIALAGVAVCRRRQMRKSLARFSV